MLKMLRVMRLTAILLTVCCLHTAAKSRSQEVSFSGREVKLETVFRSLEQQTGYFVMYPTGLLDEASTVSIDLKDYPLTDFLRALLHEQPFEFAVESTTVFIRKKIPEPTPVLEAPPITVRGRIVNENGEPVIASVTIKGTNRGTTSDANGEFQLAGVEDNATLVITATNIENLEYRLANSPGLKSGTIINISAKTTATSLNEIVVNKGYYTESKRLSTGSVGRVSAADIGKQPVSNPLQAIYAKVPGVLITQQSGIPGGNINIQIRGQNSLRNTMGDNGNYPLYVVDGVPYFSTPLTTNAGATLYPQGNYARGASPFSSLNPADIEAIEILKDADATAIYGSRGANGVILITTKKGKSGAMRVDANFYAGAGEVTRRMKLLNTQQYLEMRKEAFKNDGIPAYSDFDYDVNGTWDENKNHDWQQELFGGTAKSTDAQLSVSGGNSVSQYRFGGGYHRETSVFPGDFSDQRGSGHVSLINNSLNNKFRSQISINYSIGLTDMPGQDLTSSALSMVPNMPDMIDSDGNLLWGTGIFSNPYAATKQPYKAKSANFISNVNLSYELLPGLLIKTNLGYTNASLKEIQKTPVSTQIPQFQQFFTNNTVFGNSTSNSWIIEPQLNFQQVFNKHSINVLVGTSFQNEERDQLLQNANGFSSEALMENISAVPNTNVFNTYSYFKYRYNSIFGRLNYSYMNKYLLNVTGRRDGSSRFGPGKQFANFGSAGAAWIFSEESFMQKMPEFLNYGKLRGSYGITGNDQILNYGFLDNYTSSGGGQYQGVSGLAPARLFNEDFRWETNKKLEIAMELGLLQSRLQLTVAFFRNRSSNQLVGYSLPPTAGFPNIQYNLPATVQNTGVEIELTARILNKKNFNWSGSFNISVPRNKLIEYPNIEASSYVLGYVVGQPLNILRRFKFLGVDPETGLYTVEDVNRDNSFNASDYVVNSFLGQRFYGGFQNTIEISRITIDFLVQFVKQRGRNYLSDFGSPPGSMSNQPVEVLNRWREEGDVAPIQKFSTFFPFSYNLFAGSDAGVSDASFIRLKNLSVSYKFPNTVLNKIKVKDLKIYIQGQNLITITNYRGLDPETQGTALPPLRVLAAGLQLGL